MNIKKYNPDGSAQVYKDSLEVRMTDKMVHGSDLLSSNSDVEKAEEEVYMHNIISQLKDPKDKKIVKLIFEGRSNWSDIAREMNIPVPTMHHRKERLQKLLKDYYNSREKSDTVVATIIMLVTLSYLKQLPNLIFKTWNDDTRTKHKKKPSISFIRKQIEDTLLSVAGGKVVYRND